MKILCTNGFISERMKAKPVTNAEWDNIKQSMKYVKNAIDINNVNADVFDEFGFVLETKNGVDFITVGKFRPVYMRWIDESAMMAICYSTQDKLGWLCVRKDHYHNFPLFEFRIQSDADIVKIFETNIKPEDIETADGLKETYKNYNLKSLL